MNTPRLSILIPSIPSRITRFAIPLFEKLSAQADRIGSGVEILMLTDNKARTVGLKRQALLDSARGDYVAFCDDDDDVEDDYLAALLTATDKGADVITFLQRAIVNGQEGTIHFSASHPHDESFAPGKVARRRPWHVCAYRRELVAACLFTDKMWGEDADWVDQAAPLLRTGSHIDRILQTYRYDDKISEAPNA
jgi:glycosyltransferase involved in cell wall biosynthesis